MNRPCLVWKCMKMYETVWKHWSFWMFLDVFGTSVNCPSPQWPLAVRNGACTPRVVYQLNEIGIYSQYSQLGSSENWLFIIFPVKMPSWGYPHWPSKWLSFCCPILIAPLCGWSISTPVGAIRRCVTAVVGVTTTWVSFSATVPHAGTDPSQRDFVIQEVSH